MDVSNNLKAYFSKKKKDEEKRPKVSHTEWKTFVPIDLVYVLENSPVGKLRPSLENWIFKIYYVGTKWILITFFALLAFQKKSIQCTHTNFQQRGSDHLKNIMHTYCYYLGTFTRLNETADEEEIYSGVSPLPNDDNYIFHNYYQWVPYFLIFQLICFYIPHIIWKSNNLLQKTVYKFQLLEIMEGITIGDLLKGTVKTLGDVKSIIYSKVEKPPTVEKKRPRIDKERENEKTEENQVEMKEDPSNDEGDDSDSTLVPSEEIAERQDEVSPLLQKSSPVEQPNDDETLKVSKSYLNYEQKIKFVLLKKSMPVKNLANHKLIQTSLSETKRNGKTVLPESLLKDSVSSLPESQLNDRITILSESELKNSYPLLTELQPKNCITLLNESKVKDWKIILSEPKLKDFIASLTEKLPNHDIVILTIQDDLAILIIDGKNAETKQIDRITLSSGKEIKSFITMLIEISTNFDFVLSVVEEKGNLIIDTRSPKTQPYDDEEQKDSTASLTDEVQKGPTASLTEEEQKGPTASLTEEEQKGPTASFTDDEQKGPTASLTDDEQKGPTASLTEEEQKGPTASLTDDEQKGPTASLTDDEQKGPTASLTEEEQKGPTASLTDDKQKNIEDDIEKLIENQPKLNFALLTMEELNDLKIIAVNISLYKGRIHNEVHDNKKLYPVWFLKLVGCECLNLVNLILQIFLTEVFLGYRFIELGVKVLNYCGTTEALDWVFPKIAKCNIYSYGFTGTIETRDLSCLLPLNIINEKFFLFLWFWYLILLIMTSLSFINRILKASLHKKTCCVFQPFAESTVNLNILKNNMKYWDWFFVKSLSKSLNSNVAEDLCQFLVAKLNEKTAE